MDVVISDSTVPFAGKGVFANKNFKKGEVLCYYGGKLIRNSDIFSYTDSKYVLSLDKNFCVVGYDVPSPTAPLWVAQFMNDYEDIHIDDTDNVCSILMKVDNYRESSLENENVYNENICFRASRDIEKGEELFLSYGDSYWISQNKNHYRKIGNWEVVSLIQKAQQIIYGKVSWEEMKSTE